MPSRISLTLTPRDLEILETLTLRVRLLSVAQVARTWWATSRNAQANARARLKQLEQAGLVARFTMMAHPELHLTSPIFTWNPGPDLPNFGPGSYQLKSRWCKPLESTPSVIATEIAGHRFGGKGGRYPRPTEQTHDLHMAAVFLHFRLLDPVVVKSWFSEELLRGELLEGGGQKLPDAVIRTDRGERVIEFGGSYSKEKLHAFHEFCAERNLPYEVW